jgi:hypothetical protein
LRRTNLTTIGTAPVARSLSIHDRLPCRARHRPSGLHYDDEADLAAVVHSATFLDLEAVRQGNASIVDLVELGMASWLVIMLRSAQLAAAPHPLVGRDKREVERMVSEKVQAWFDSADAMARHSMRYQTRVASAALRMAFVPTLASWQAAVAATATGMGGATQAGLRPYRRRSRANLRRLSRA